MNTEIFDTIIVITDKDFSRVAPLYGVLVKNLPGRDIIFVGPPAVEGLVEKLHTLIRPEIRAGNDLLEKRCRFLCENDILPFDRVHSFMAEHMKTFLNGQELPRGVVGWYYQQFLKLAYAAISENEYYMTWDGDTIPCAPFSMFDEAAKTPYMDMKREYHEEYFVTMAKLIPGLGKCLERSFISEHLLFGKALTGELIKKIEGNDSLKGQEFWEKIISAIPPERITKSAFSEFETYGSFVARTHPDSYRLRTWHSFRTGGDFFDINTICDRDFEWLSKDFMAISFEKWSEVREDHRNLFDNPEYQKKLSARQMLEIAQEEFTDGYKEIWD